MTANTKPYTIHDMVSDHAKMYQNLRDGKEDPKVAVVKIKAVSAAVSMMNSMLKDADQRNETPMIDFMAKGGKALPPRRQPLKRTAAKA